MEEAVVFLDLSGFTNNRFLGFVKSLVRSKYFIMALTGHSKDSSGLSGNSWKNERNVTWGYKFLAFWFLATNPGMVCIERTTSPEGLTSDLKNPFALEKACNSLFLRLQAMAVRNAVLMVIKRRQMSASSF